MRALQRTQEGVRSTASLRLLYLAGWGGARMHPAAALHDVRSRRWAMGGWRGQAAALCWTGPGGFASSPLAAGLRRKDGQAVASGGQ